MQTGHIFAVTMIAGSSLSCRVSKTDPLSSKSLLLEKLLIYSTLRVRSTLLIRKVDV